MYLYAVGDLRQWGKLSCFIAQPLSVSLVQSSEDEWLHRSNRLNAELAYSVASSTDVLFPHKTALSQSSIKAYLLSPTGQASIKYRMQRSKELCNSFTEAGLIVNGPVLFYKM